MHTFTVIVVSWDWTSEVVSWPLVVDVSGGQHSSRWEQLDQRAREFPEFAGTTQKELQVVDELCAKNQGDQWWKISSECILGQSWILECGFVVNSRSLQADRLLGCALDKEWAQMLSGTEAGRNLPRCSCFSETGKISRWGNWKKGMVQNCKQEFFSVFFLVLLPCPAVVFMNGS